MIKNQQDSVTSPITSKPFLGVILLFAVISLLNIPVLITLWRHGFDDGTYSHAFLIPFISLYLYYELAESGKLQFRAKPSAIPTILLVLSCYLLFVTSNAQISIGYWSALLAVFITSVTMLYRFNWYIVFPAAFLIFIFPFWGGLVPILQNISVIAVTYMMGFTGVPTFVEAELITIPAGVFEIAGGCSGLRYMIVSLAIGSLFIFLNIRDTKKAALFLLLTILGALLTNWIRITALILIGEYTNMESSLMEDHNTFGWYLYAPFMILLFVWGGRLSTTEEPTIDKDYLRDTKINNALLIYTTAIIIISSTSLKALLPSNIPNVQNKQLITGQPQPDILFFSSIEQSVKTTDKYNEIYNIYSFDNNDLDSKATYFKNNIIPNEWQIIQKEVVDNWHVYTLRAHNQSATLRVSYEIGGEKFALKRQLKLKRLSKNSISLSKSKLHWKFQLCSKQSACSKAI
jgi:exosortase A